MVTTHISHENPNGGKSMKSRTRLLCLLLFLAVMPMTLTGCFGSFELWHKVHDWNNDVHSPQDS